MIRRGSNWDGTGPDGLGPSTGRGQGPCQCQDVQEGDSMQDVAAALLDVAQSLMASEKREAGVKFTVDSKGEFFASLRSLVKNRGLYKSDAQGKFLLRQAKRGVRLDTDMYVFYAKQIKRLMPAGTVGVIVTEYLKEFGRKTRFLTYIYWLDDHGVIQEAKVHYKYDDIDGGAQGIKANVTFERPSDLADEFGVTEHPDDAWFREHADEVTEVIEALKGDNFFGKWVKYLEVGDTVPPKIWDMMVEEVARRKRTEGAASFPTGKNKMTIQLKVSRVKYKKSSFSTGWNTSTTDHIVLMGDVVGYREFGCIKVTAKKIAKQLGLDDEVWSEDFFDRLEDAAAKQLIGRTVALTGTFSSNGKMIFGSRVTMVKK